MMLSPRERDKLLIYMAASLARERRARGLKLNHPEAVAIVTAEVLEGIRDGKTVAELMHHGATILLEGRCDGGGRRDDPRDPGRGHVPPMERSW